MRDTLDTELFAEQGWLCLASPGLAALSEHLCPLPRALLWSLRAVWVRCEGAGTSRVAGLTSLGLVSPPLSPGCHCAGRA